MATNSSNVDLGLPAQFRFGLGGVAQQQFDFGGAEIFGVDFDDDLAGLCVDPLFVHTLHPAIPAACRAGQRPFQQTHGPNGSLRWPSRNHPGSACCSIIHMAST